MITTFALLPALWLAAADEPTARSAELADSVIAVVQEKIITRSDVEKRLPANLTKEERLRYFESVLSDLLRKAAIFTFYANEKSWAHIGYSLPQEER